jgi:hypothetical protein
MIGQDRYIKNITVIEIQMDLEGIKMYENMNKTETESYTSTNGYLVKLKAGKKIYCNSFVVGKGMVTVRDLKGNTWIIPFNSIKYINDTKWWW